MAILSTIVLKNAASANVTFSRQAVSGELATLSSGNVAFSLKEKLVIQSSFPKPNRTSMKVAAKLTYPKIVTNASGVQEVSDEAIGKIELVRPANFTDTEWAEVEARVKALAVDPTLWAATKGDVPA